MVIGKDSHANFNVTFKYYICKNHPCNLYLDPTEEKQHMSRVLSKAAFCICENKDADQLRGNREVDQRLCFRYTDSTIPLVPKYKISGL